MRIGLVLPRINSSTLRLATQLGVTDIVANLPGNAEGHPLRGPGTPVLEFTRLLHTKEEIEAAGLCWSVLERLQIPDRVKLGLDGRDEDIDHVCQSIRNLGTVGIPIVCYHWMTYIHHFRTSHAKRVRGGAVSTEYRHVLMERAPLTELGATTEDTLWASLGYFLEAVVPVAEEAGVRLAMHPDDPPLSPLRGLARIMTSPNNFQRMLDLVPSAHSGLTFCQGCFSEMGCDIPSTLAGFCRQEKVFFAHFATCGEPGTISTRRFTTRGTWTCTG